MKALAAMSGGVDSSVAAALIKEQGFETIGVTLKLLPRAETGFGCCGSPADIDDARRVCEQLDIPHYTMDLAELFERRVIEPFVRSYLDGKTPNPCVECNRHVKFGHFLGLAEALGCDFVATGHYARLEGGRLAVAKDLQKDQTYFLYRLASRELSRARFPLGGLDKAEVRAYARKLGLRTADKPESQEICFVPRRDYRGFISSRLEAPSLEATLSSGTVEDASGRRLGSHSGVASYTIGQRKGVVWDKTPSEPMYVVGLKPDSNTVVVGSAGETLTASFFVGDVSWTGEPPEGPIRAQVRIRHRHKPAQGLLVPIKDSRWRVDFDEPQRAVTPGQAAVFYNGDWVLGGGGIE